MNKLIERIGKTLISFWFLGFAFYMVESATVGMLAIIGLAEWQRTLPHALDHSWMNFDFYWGLVNAYQITQFVIMFIGIYFIIKNIVKRKSNEVKK